MTERLTTLELDQQRRYEQGDPILVEAYLADAPELEAHPDAVVRLLIHEFRLRRRHGETPTIEEYAARFPEYQDLLQPSFLAELATSSVDSGGCARTDFPHLQGYRVVAELGRGGMGTVYKAWHERLSCWVALKTLRGTTGGERLRVEAEAIARLGHPNIIRIHDIVEWETPGGRVPVLVLEYSGGGSLAQHLGGRPQEPREAAKLVETLAHAVQHAHQAGIIHRDLKPANVLLTSPDEGENQPRERLPEVSQVKITDFGLAKDLHLERGLTATGDVLGTPSYMAPEQVRSQGEAISPAVDVYALGAILYELLTGRPPFQAATNVETALLVLRDDPVPPRRLRPNLPGDLETICLKCLERIPSRRYASAAALAEDLRRFLELRPIHARPVSPLRRAAKWARRNPALATAMLLVAVALSALAAQWYRFTMDLKAQRDQAEANAAEATRQSTLAVANLRRAREAALQFYYTVRDHKELRSTATQTMRLALLRQALDLQERLLDDYAALPELQDEQANSYLTLATLVVELDSPRASIPYLRKALEIGERLVDQHPENLSYQANLANYQSSLALRLSDLGETKEAEQLARQAIERGEQVVTANRPGKQSVDRFNLASAKINLGLLLRRLHRLPEAEALYVSARRDAEETVRHEPNVPDYLNQLGMICNNLAVLYQRSSRLDQAEEGFSQAIRWRTALLELAPGQPQYQQALAITWYNAAGLYRVRKQNEQAERAFARAIEMQSQLVQAHPRPKEYRISLARMYQGAGEFFQSRGRASEATEAFRQAGLLRRELAKESQTDPSR